MKIQLLSDLHNEFLRHSTKHQNHLWQGVIPDADANLIILAGDIDVGAKGIEWAITESERLSKDIIYILGNHEFYRHEYFDLKATISKLCEGTRVNCMDPGMLVQQDVRLIGASLWTDYKVNPNVTQELAMCYVERVLNDHRAIRYQQDDATGNFTPAHALGIHIYEMEWIKTQLAIPFDGKTIVITHHAPHPICQHPGFPFDKMSTAFQSDLSEVIETNDIDVWVFGHTHANLDQTISGTRILSNQAGYPGENVTNFDPGLIFEL